MALPLGVPVYVTVYGAFPPVIVTTILLLAPVQIVVVPVIVAEIAAQVPVPGVTIPVVATSK